MILFRVSRPLNCYQPKTLSVSSRIIYMLSDGVVFLVLLDNVLVSNFVGVLNV